MKKKCVFPKLGTRTHQLGKNKGQKNALSANKRAKALTKWRNGWFESN